MREQTERSSWDNVKRCLEIILGKWKYQKDFCWLDKGLFKIVEWEEWENQIVGRVD